MYVSKDINSQACSAGAKLRLWYHQRQIRVSGIEFVCQEYRHLAICERATLGQPMLGEGKYSTATQQKCVNLRIPRRLLESRCRFTTRPESLILTPYHCERSSTVIQFSFLLQLASSVVLYKATSASRSVCAIVAGTCGEHTERYASETTTSIKCAESSSSWNG